MMHRWAFEVFIINKLSQYFISVETKRRKFPSTLFQYEAIMKSLLHCNAFFYLPCAHLFYAASYLDKIFKIR